MLVAPLLHCKKGKRGDVKTVDFGGILAKFASFLPSLNSPNLLPLEAYTTGRSVSIGPSACVSLSS